MFENILIDIEDLRVVMDVRRDNYKQSDHNGGCNTVLCHDIVMIGGPVNPLTKNAIIPKPLES